MKATSVDALGKEFTTRGWTWNVRSLADSNGHGVTWMYQCMARPLRESQFTVKEVASSPKLAMERAIHKVKSMAL